MDDITKGTWLINTYKHFVGLRQDAPELSHFEATEGAGKSGALLARLSADQSEIIPADKVKAFARQSNIRGGELPACLRNLRKQDKIDYTGDPYDAISDVEVYCFSTQDALSTTSAVYNALAPTTYENASLISLGETFLLPRSDQELLETLTSQGLSEEQASTTLRLQEALYLVQVAKGPELAHPIFFNEHAFTGNPAKIALALQGLTAKEHQEVEDIQNLVNDNPGYPLDDLQKQHSQKIINMMEGVGLLDAVPIKSETTNAVFVTGPQLRGISIDALPLSVDVFHKAKVLLSCLRFGQLKSNQGRGKIDTSAKMMNIVNKLLRGEWVGPCTAIGEDYKLLELDGVIATHPVNRGWYNQYQMYEMNLRQKEVGQLVKQMLEYKRALPETGTDFETILIQEPVVSYDMPETRRHEILARETKPVKEIRNRLLQTLRTGMRR